MRLLVLGASGGTGREVVAQALGHGHDVTALMREPGRLDISDPQLRVIAGDVTDPARVAAAVDGQDAVASALGSRSERPVHVYSDGIANTIRAMTARGVRRLVVVSAAYVGGGVGLPLPLRLLGRAPGVAGVREDMELMEDDVQLSDLDWTIVRAAALTNGPFTGVYRVVENGAVPGGRRISRPDLAALLLKCAEGSHYLRRTVAVAY